MNFLPSVLDLEPDPDSATSWHRIRIRNTDPDPEAYQTAQKCNNLLSIIIKLKTFKYFLQIDLKTSWYLLTNYLKRAILNPPKFFFWKLSKKPRPGSGSVFRFLAGFGSVFNWIWIRNTDFKASVLSCPGLHASRTDNQQHGFQVNQVMIT